MRRPLEHRLRRGVMHVLAGVRSRGAARNGFRGAQRVLVVRAHNEVGDALIMTACLAALAKTARRPKIMVVCREKTEFVYEQNPHIGSLVVLEPSFARAHPIRAIGAMRRIRAFAPDVAVVPATISLSLFSTFVGLASGAGAISGGAGPPGGVYEGVRLPFDTVAAFPAGTHHAERNRLHFAPLGVEKIAGREIFLTDSEREAGLAALADAGLGGRRPVLLLPGAGKAQNRWPVERFVEIGVQGARRRVPVAVSTGPGERELGEALVAGLAARKVRAAILDGLPWRTLAAVGELSRVWICNDTGVLHLGAAVGCPTVSVFGPTLASEWAPAGKKHVAIQAPTGRVADVPAALVARAALPFLA